jgi:hypothetical protein
MKFDPHSGLLHKPPLPRSTGERKRRPQGLTPFLYPTKWGRGADPANIAVQMANAGSDVDAAI